MTSSDHLARSRDRASLAFVLVPMSERRSCFSPIRPSFNDALARGSNTRSSLIARMRARSPPWRVTREEIYRAADDRVHSVTWGRPRLTSMPSERKIISFSARRTFPSARFANLRIGSRPSGLDDLRETSSSPVTTMILRGPRRVTRLVSGSLRAQRRFYERFAVSLATRRQSDAWDGRKGRNAAGNYIPTCYINTASCSRSIKGFLAVFIILITGCTARSNRGAFSKNVGLASLETQRSLRRRRRTVIVVGDQWRVMGCVCTCLSTWWRRRSVSPKEGCFLHPAARL